MVYRRTVEEQNEIFAYKLSTKQLQKQEEMAFSPDRQEEEEKAEENKLEVSQMHESSLSQRADRNAEAAEGVMWYLGNSSERKARRIKQKKD